MPLILDPSGLPIERLRGLLAETRSGLESLLVWVRAPSAPIKEPLGLRTAEDLLLAALAETAQVGPDEPDADRLAAAL